MRAEFHPPRIDPDATAAKPARRHLERDSARALTPTGGFLRGFAFTLNPYIGCAFGAAGGCPFCYVRAMPVAHAAPGPWGTWVIAKRNLAALLEREIGALEAKGWSERAAVFMSSATDPYQGIERRLGLTRAALATLAVRPPRRLIIQTRSPLVERDIDLILRMGSRARVSLTIETDDDTVRRAITPTSPSIMRRVECARRLRRAGIFVQIAIAPMLPNRPAAFAALLDGAADRVIVDTLLDGDGAAGARSRALGVDKMLAGLGYGGWFSPGAEADLLAAMSARFGPGRVLFSREGFNDV